MGKRRRMAGWFHRTGTMPWLESVRALLRSDLRILAYHRVLESADPPGFRFDPELISASSEQFHDQMKLLRQRFHPLSFEELLACIDRGSRLPRHAVMVTFDDGYDDNYRVAFPILRDLGMSAMFFVSTGHIDSGQPYAYDWLVHMICTTAASRLDVPEVDLACAMPDALEDRRELAMQLLDRIKHLDADVQSGTIRRLEQAWDIPRTAHPDCRPMNWDQLREMQRCGMEIGSHGVDHLMLAKLPPDRMRREILESKQTLERELGVPAKVLSYPVGGPHAFDGAVEDTVREAGYRLACSYIAGTSTTRADARYSLRRVAVERQVDAPWFEAIVTLPEAFCYAPHQRNG